jgi:predicted regulator of Ras-like GTPase activity (Roadblock/LC7/MglB family)
MKEITMPRKTKSQEEKIEDSPSEPESTIEESTTAPKHKLQYSIGNLHANLENIKTREGVVGYIFRTQKSASIDLKDPTKIIDYAVLSSTVLEAGENLADTFELGNIHKVTLEGKDIKLLALKIGDNRLSIFMNKTADQERIYKDLNIT